MVPAVAGIALLAGVLLPVAAATANVLPVTLFSSTAPGYVPAAAVVPAGICAVEGTVAGGPGGAGHDDTEAPAGGAGAVVTATMVVSPGEVLDAEVAGAGQSAGTGTDSYGYTGYAGAGGVGGGGGGGVDVGMSNANGTVFPYAGGGGGGASVVSSAGTPLVVAGGGGGGGDGSGTAGGAGGLLGANGGGGVYGGSATGENFAPADQYGGQGGSTQPNGGSNSGSGTVGGGGDGGGDAQGKGGTPADEMGAHGSGVPGGGQPAEEGPLGFGGVGNTTGGDGGDGGQPDNSSNSQGGGGGGGGVGFGGGGGGEAGGGGAGYAGGSGSVRNDPSGGGGGSSFVAPTVDGGSALSSLSSGDVTISYNPVNDVCGLTTLYASATAAPGSGGGATAADPCDLTEALLRVPAGGTVFLVTPGDTTAPSRYVGNWSVTTPGTSTLSPVTIEPLPGLATQPILDGDGPGAPAGEVCQTPLIPVGQDPSDANGYPSCIAAVLTVAAGVHVDLEGTTVADGYYGTFIDQGSGGGLTADGQVMVTDDSFTDNTGDAGAAAISVGGEGSVTVTSSTFTDNTNVDDFSYRGGAITNTSGGTLDVTGSTFTGNTDPAGTGGAIATTTPTHITDSTFTDNSADRAGAVDGEALITDSTFIGNSATTGGAVAIEGSGGTVAGSSFSDDTATDGSGGAIYDSGPLNVTDSTFIGNTATAAAADRPFLGNGGAIDGGPLTVTDSTFSANAAAGDGGAIDDGDNVDGLGFGTTLTVADSTFAANTATDGGAIDTSDNGPSSSYATVTASTFTANTATDGPSIDSGDNDANLNGAQSSDPTSGPDGTVEVAADIFDGVCDQGAGAWIDDGYNAGTSTTCFRAPQRSTDVQAAELDLAPLADNGGPTETVEPELGSPAIGIIPALTTTTVDGSQAALCPTTDQRGFPSITGTPCNAGAVQTTAAVPPPALPEVADPALLAIPGAGIGGFVLYKRRRRHARRG
jgi:hypothetical protein